jgi:hypothetical protein
MWVAATSTGLSTSLVVTIFSVALAAGVSGGAIYRRRVSKVKGRWLGEAAASGYVDENNIFHPGAVQKVNGWTDTAGWHRGLDVRMDTMERDFYDRHLDDPTAHTRGT